MKRVRPEIGTGTVRVVGDLGKSRNWESRKQKWARGRKSKVQSRKSKAGPRGKTEMGSEM